MGEGVARGASGASGVAGRAGCICTPAPCTPERRVQVTRRRGYRFAPNFDAVANHRSNCRVAQAARAPRRSPARHGSQRPATTARQALPGVGAASQSGGGPPVKADALRSRGGVAARTIDPSRATLGDSDGRCSFRVPRARSWHVVDIDPPLFACLPIVGLGGWRWEADDSLGALDGQLYRRRTRCRERKDSDHTARLV